MPSSNSIFGERIELLDKLIELPLKGFPQINDTPTSGITSLPTPIVGEEHPPLNDHVDHETSPHQITYPSAPHLKDLDSFTEGTGGSFDFLADEDNFEDPPPPPPLNSLSLSLLPPQECLSIELWREDVYYHTPNSSEPPSRAEEPMDCDASLSDSSSSHSKRPRSVASDDVARRTRLRAQSAAASPFAADTQFYVGIAAPPADVRPLVRPQLRRTRSLPLRPD